MISGNFTKAEILRRQSTQTHDVGEAAREALRLAKIDDDIWAALRNGAQDIESANETIRLNADTTFMRRIMKARATPPEHHFSDALNIYFRKHHPGKGTKFVADVNRVFNFAKGIIGDPALSKIKRLDASKVLDAMLARDWKTASVRRNMAVLSAIFNIGILEYEIDAKNPFAAHKIPNLFEDARKVLSFSETELRQIADAALSQKKPEGLICAMLINLGCRVSEVAMLRRGDLHPDAEIPYVDIREHKEHQRTLKKGKASERILPLLGVSLQAARLARASAKDGGWLFDIGHRNPSAQVNRWLVRNFGEEAGRSHSFRHSLETRTRFGKG